MIKTYPVIFALRWIAEDGYERELAAEADTATAKVVAFKFKGKAKDFQKRKGK